MLEQIKKKQRGLARERKTKSVMRDIPLNTCRDVKECVFPYIKPSITREAPYADIHTTIEILGRIAGINNL